MSRKKNKICNKQTKQLLALILIIICSILFGGNILKNDETNSTLDVPVTSQTATYFDINSIPEYTDTAYITINNNVPYFDESEYIIEAFENYSDLDNLGRCGVAYSNICKEIMPTEKRKAINKVEPTGWVQKKYNGEYLYNRCHLIGHLLAGEDDNKLNLITGTRYFNINRNVTI